MLAESGNADMHIALRGDLRKKGELAPRRFIEIIDGKNASQGELREWCRQNLAGFKVPSEFRFESIPKTSTGKIQKYALRQRIAVGVDPD